MYEKILESEFSGESNIISFYVVCVMKLTKKVKKLEERLFSQRNRDKYKVSVRKDSSNDQFHTTGLLLSLGTYIDIRKRGMDKKHICKVVL